MPPCHSGLRGSKWSKMINMTQFWSFGAILGPFGLLTMMIHHKNWIRIEWRLWSCLTIASLSDKLWAWMMTKTATAKSKGSQASIAVHSLLVMVLVIMIMITGVHYQCHDQMVELMIMVMIKGWKRRFYPECEDEKNREPDDHGVQKARGLFHLSGVFSL